MSPRSLVAVGIAVALLVLPAAASANQTLTVEKQGSGIAGSSVESSPSGISCGPNCAHSFADDALVTLVGTPGANSQPPTWSGCDSVTAENRCVVTMSEAKEVVAIFDLVERKLTVSLQGDRTGTVTSSPAGVECGVECEAEYPHGTQVVLTGTPTAPHGGQPTWAGCLNVNASDQCEVTMTQAREVTATFDLERHPLTVMTTGTGTGTVQGSPGPISCGAVCSAEYEYGQTITLSGAPGAHTHAAQWTGCDAVVSGECEVTMGSSAKTVTAAFDLIRFSLAVAKTGEAAATASVSSEPSGIDCGPTCSADYTEGTAVVLVGHSGPNTAAVAWSGCEHLLSGNRCEEKMNGERSLGASFEPQPGHTLVTLGIEKPGEGIGTVTSSPGGIDCGAVCSTELIEGATVTLSATPGPGSAFDHWSGGGCSGTFPGCATTLGKAKTVKAYFELAGTRTLSVSTAGSGKGTVIAKAVGIDCGSACSAQVSAGKKASLRAKPAKGSSFVRWLGDCSGTAKRCKLKMSGGRQVTAVFSTPPQAGASPQATAHARCVVPKLKGKTLKQAKKALRRRHCSLGKVRGPKRGRKRLRVRSSKPKAGKRLKAGAKVAVVVGGKGKRGRKRGR
jgi:Divergent InlB B-repeat domain/PASTA domain